ncbi:hypothetical protein [Actinoallomurus iriomotensis]|uniref:Uncharacterized protein n=1 Tax=Actinoallomurus iriomotensis TaxID=478107 RepID=A0A9W6RG87_9ACTN|nr:hypothetical protein [Actinoallomurus iriomotensis]GLY73360.1 hypothetical protein Airi01_016270 [Actinoallomurus iriomotensis]
MKDRNRFRRVGGYLTGALIAVGVAASGGFRPGGVPVTILVFFAAGVAALGYVTWRLVTGRDGLWRRGPTRRRRDRLERRSSGVSPTDRRPP